jgi:uncharacterized Rossmann fold enzyme
MFGMRGFGGMQGDRAEFLAEALGISVEALAGCPAEGT